MTAPLSPELERKYRALTARTDGKEWVSAREVARDLLAEIDRLRAERHTTNEALDDAAQALRSGFNGDHLQFLSFALELAGDAVANNPGEFTPDDRSALELWRRIAKAEVTP